MSERSDQPGIEPELFDDDPIEAGEVASAGRSCLVLMILTVAIVVVLCVGIAARWAMAS